MRNITHQRRAFTLVEMLVVIGIVAVLIAFLFPLLSKARHAAARSQCASQLCQIGVGLTNYFNEWHYLPNRPDGLSWCNPHVMHYLNDPGDVSSLMLKYCGPKSLFYCPEGFEQRTADTWWPFHTGSIAATYQFPFWVDTGNWLIEPPNYRRLTSDRLLGCDILATSDGVSQIIEYNHGVRDNGKLYGMNMLFGDGHVAWNDASGGWVAYTWYDANLYWHYAQYQ